ncbi:MAG: DUF4350 domain-containing protein [Methanoregula sp.]|jgi:hypothetical protein
MKPVSWIVLLILGFACCLLLVYLSGNTAEFGRHNPGWNGTSRFFDALDRHHLAEIENPSGLSGYTNSTLLVVSPYRQFTRDDLRAYRDFVDRGNTLILADDFGTGNELLAGIGSSLMILPGNLSGVDRLYDSSYTVVAYPAESATLPVSGQKFVLDMGAAVRGGTPDLVTGLMSWVDTTGSPGPGPGTQISGYPVAAHESVGQGTVYVIGDPSFFINSMLETKTGYADKDAMVRLIPARDTVIVDAYSTRAAAGSGFWNAVHAIRTDIAIKMGIVAIILIVAGIVWKKKIV